MTKPPQKALTYTRDQKDPQLQELIEFCSIPSISTDPKYDADVKLCANWVADRLRKIGIKKVEIFPTKGHPVVYGADLSAGPQAKTVLIYGHYDVQPAEPMDKWSSPPFDPIVREEHLYARGSTDMKAQVLATLYAVEAILKSDQLPVNVKFMIEGEEEIGSPNLEEFILDHRDLLACDVFLNPDTGMVAENVPTITYALRGLAYFEVWLQGPKSDLHSGVFGGVVHNPAQVLCELIAGMHDEQGRITLPGFYDRVIAMEAEEREELARIPMNEDTFLALSGAPELWHGEKGFSAIERQGGRPTLEINGIHSGFTGEGSKTVLPARAMAKISTRLVADQDPKEVYQQLLEYMEQNTPATMTWEVKELVGSKASLSDLQSDGVKAMGSALEQVWGIRPVYKREGGSVPVVTQMQQILDVNAVNTGFSMPGDNMHGPDEKTHLPSWRKGIEAFIYFLYNLK